MNTSSGSEVDDPLQEARAYNQSIYLMVGVPYFLLGAGGLFVYRGYRAALKRAQSQIPVSEGAAEFTDSTTPDREQRDALSP
ncbi:MAG TPA: hypothetical protein VK395_08665 [Gemmataceae bacterium]|nr:hypothetical protein [Gemmataceae bacterium]